MGGYGLRELSIVALGSISQSAAIVMGINAEERFAK